MNDSTPRRVVTGHDQDGKSVVLSDGPPPQHPARMAFFHIDAGFSADLLEVLPQPLELMR